MQLNFSRRAGGNDLLVDVSNYELMAYKMNIRKHKEFEIVNYLSFRRVHIKICGVETTRKMGKECKLLLINLRKQSISRLFFNVDR